MGNWYIVKEDGLPDTETLLVEDRNNVVYERFIINEDGASWKAAAKTIFHGGYTSERFKKYMERSDNEVIEITEEEAFTIML
jgi:hypothetical protein